MAGVPYHSAQSYINRLLKAGHRVAMCEQTQDPEEAKGIVDRAVVRVITPICPLENTVRGFTPGSEETRPLMP